MDLNRTAVKAVFALLVVFQAQANETSSTEVIVVTNARSEQPLEQISRSISSVSNKEIQLVTAAHIQQLLNRQPGVNLHRNSGMEYLSSIRSPVLTGAGACGEYLILENGVPLRPAGMCNVNELFESHSEIAQNIEIVRGSSSEFYGSNGLHGVINITTPALLENNGRMSLTLGEHSYQQLKFNHKFDDLQIAGSINNDGGFRDESGYDQQKVTVKHLYKNQYFETESIVTAFNLNQQTAGYLIGLNSYKDKALISNNPNPEAYRHAKGFRALQHYYLPNDTKITPYVRYSEMAFLQHFLPGKPIEQNNQTSVGLQSQKLIELAKNLELHIGLDTEFANIELLQYQPNETVGSAFLQATIPQGKHYDYQVDSSSVATFASISYQLTDKLRWNVGARLEYLQYDYDNRMVTGRTDEFGTACGFGGCRYSRPEDDKNSFTNLSPKIGVSYQPNENNLLFASVNHGFRAPQATELYRLQRAQTITDLDSVESKGIDLGWRFSTTNGIDGELNAYYYEKENGIIRNTDFFNISGADSEHLGFELSLTKAVNDHYKVGGNYSFGKHSYRNNPGISATDIIGLDIDSAPRHLANLLVNFEKDNYSWELHGQYNGKYFTDVENQHEYSGHMLFHWRGKYQVSKGLSLALHVLNLTDKRYADRADFSGFSGDRYFPGEPRNVKLQLNYSY